MTEVSLGLPSADSRESNLNKITRIEQLRNELEKIYHEALDAAIGITAQQVSLKRSIQKAALTLEEIYKLHGQEDMIQEIGSLIVNDLKVRGFPESKYLYVYEALNVYDHRFTKTIDHSSSQSLSPLSKRTELFYHARAKRYYDAVTILKELENDYDNLLRRDMQTILPDCLELYNKNWKNLKRLGIDVSPNRQDAFDGGPERFSETIRIKKPIPRVPLILKEELEIWIKQFLPAMLQKFTEYPINDAEIERRMAAGWAAIRHMYDPVTDDKYREMYPDWIDIVQFATKSFKHHAASQYKSIDWRGLPRKLTREQIGARQKTIPMWCKWFFECVPGFVETMAWFRNDKKMWLSGFSIDLGPKLSDRSIK